MFFILVIRTNSSWKMEESSRNKASLHNGQRAGKCKYGFGPVSTDLSIPNILSMPPCRNGVLTTLIPLISSYTKTPGFWH